jgi:hypothetical protein
MALIDRDIRGRYALRHRKERVMPRRDLSKLTEEQKDALGKDQNDLINQRLTWLGTFSSLLFVANGYGKFPILIPIVGFGIALSIWVGTSAANVMLDDLERNVTGARKPFMPGTFIPPLFGLAWVAVFVMHFTCLKG